MKIASAKEPTVYQKTYHLGMTIFELYKNFPPEERCALVRQVRRSSRSICPNLRQARAKRRYEARFISKPTDRDGENAETDTSLDCARGSQLISNTRHTKPTSLNSKIGRMVGSTIMSPEKFTLRTD
ncbi:MAG: four helix bundle protein [Verrucomicrobiota bacterium]